MILECFECFSSENERLETTKTAHTLIPHLFIDWAKKREDDIRKLRKGRDRAGVTPAHASVAQPHSAS